MAISKQTVFDACNDLYIQDKKVTLDAVRNITGGSFSTLSPLIKEWKTQSTNIDASTESQLSHSTVPQKLTDLLNTMWNAALSIASQQVETERQLLNNYKIELENERNEVMAAADRISAEIDELKFQLSLSKSKCEDLKKQNDELVGENISLMAKLDVSNALLSQQGRFLREVFASLKKSNTAQSDLSEIAEIFETAAVSDFSTDPVNTDTETNHETDTKSLSDVKVAPKPTNKTENKGTSKKHADTGNASGSVVPVRGKALKQDNSSSATV